MQVVEIYLLILNGRESCSEILTSKGVDEARTPRPCGTYAKYIGLCCQRSDVGMKRSSVSSFYEKTIVQGNVIQSFPSRSLT